MLCRPIQTSEPVASIGQIDQRTLRPPPDGCDKSDLCRKSFITGEADCNLDDRYFKASGVSVSNDCRLVPIALSARLAGVVVAAVALAFANVKGLPGVRSEECVYVEISLQF